MSLSAPILRRVFCLRTTLLLCALLGTNTTVKAQSNESLLGDRWQEHSYGVSLRPPLGTRLVSQTGDDAIVRFYGPDGYAVRVYIKKSSTDLTISDLVTKAIHQLGTAQPSAIILEQKPLNPAGRSGAAIYFKIPDPKRGPWVMGQAFVQINARTFVMLQLEATLKIFPSSRSIFEAVIDTLDVQDPKELDRQRATQIQAGQDWYQSITPARRRAVLRPHTWLRIVEQDTDIGYMHITQKPDTQMGLPGIRVDIWSRIQIQTQTYDSVSNFFVSNDNTHEFWSVRTTLRSPKKRFGPTAAPSWSETGVRSNEDITISLERPTGINEYKWKKPPEGYLSQAEIHMFEQLLTHKTSKEMGFYTYYPNTQKIVYRTTRAQAHPDGTLTIHTRPSPQQEEHISHYTPKGDFIKRVLPGGRLLLPASKQQIKAKWQTR